MEYYSAGKKNRASQVVLVVKKPPAQTEDRGDAGLIPGVGRSPGEGNGNPLPYSCLENLTEEPDGVQSMGSQRVGHDWSDLAYKKRDTYESVLKRGVNLDPIRESEVSQTEKDKCHTLMYIYRWNLERWYWWTSLPGSSEDADVEAGFMDTDREQEGRRNWEGTT